MIFAGINIDARETLVGVATVSLKSLGFNSISEGLSFQEIYSTYYSDLLMGIYLKTMLESFGRSLFLSTLFIVTECIDLNKFFYRIEYQVAVEGVLLPLVSSNTLN